MNDSRLTSIEVIRLPVYVCSVRQPARYAIQSNDGKDALVDVSADKCSRPTGGA